MSVKIRRKNPEALRDIMRAAKRLENKSVYVGYPASVDGEMVKRAAIHQFGSITRNIPARPFLDKGVEEGSDKYVALAHKKVKHILTGIMTVDTYYGLLGQIATAEVKKYIRNGTFTPLSPYTIARKGSSKPLIDTGQMRNTVTYEVRDND